MLIVVYCRLSAGNGVIFPSKQTKKVAKSKLFREL
jgi:hypothetical protein